MSSIDTNSAANSLVKHPFGPATILAVVAAAVMAIETKNSKTHVNISQLSSAATINATVHPEQAPGDTVLVKVSADATGRALTFGTGFGANPVTIAANKTFVIAFEFDGSVFRCTGALAQN